MTRKLFLPGAGASALFWRAVTERLPGGWDCHRLSWPGLGDEPHDPAIQGIDGLVSLVLARMTGPTDLVAQSMGGLVALKVALRSPETVRRLVLTGASGGIPVARLGGAEWRVRYRQEFPGALPWITEIQEDLSKQIPTIAAPSLLLWGERDLISPVRVGQQLLELLPNARLHIIRGGEHDFPETHLAEVASLIHEHLAGLGVK